MSNLTKKESRELDLFLAEHLFGYQRRTLADRDEIALPCDNGTTKWCGLGMVSHYCTDPAAAMQVLKKCARLLLEQDEEETVSIGCDDPYWVVEKTNSIANLRVEAATLPLAIARFARKIFEK